MQQKVQPVSGSKKSSPTSFVGELPITKKATGSMPDGTNPTTGHNGCQATASDGRTIEAVKEEKSIFAGVGIPSGVLIAIVRLYQLLVSPWKPRCCRFMPSCSNYAIEAIKVHGVLAGSRLTLWRILRCQPFCHGGYDPVPPRFESTRSVDSSSPGKKKEKDSEV